MRPTRIALAIVALACAPAAAQAPPPDGGVAPPPPSSSDVDIAKAHFNTGEAYYAHERFADAAHEFEEAYRLSGKAPLLYNVGKSYDGGNDFARALDAYRRFLAAAPADSHDRPFVEKRVELLQTLVGRIDLAGAVAGSTVTLDGNPAGTAPLPAPLLANPGRHQLALAHEGYATFKAPVDVPVGGTARVTAQQAEVVKVVMLAAPAPARDRETPIYKKWWLWTAVGGAVAVAGVITAVVLTGDSSNQGLPTVQLPQVK